MENLQDKKAINSASSVISGAIKPSSDKVLLKYIYPEKKQGAIILLNEDTSDTQLFEVVSVSEEVQNNCKPGEYPTPGSHVVIQPGLQYDLYLEKTSQKPSHCLIAWYDILATVEE